MPCPDINNKEILISLVKRYKSGEEYEELFNQTLPYSEARRMIIILWDAFIIKQIPNCKSGDDCDKLLAMTRPKSKSEKIVKEIWIALVNLELQSHNN